MIITRKYETFGSIINKKIIGNILKLLFFLIAKKIRKLSWRNDKKRILTTKVISKNISNINVNNYEEVYDTLYSSIDEAELSQMIELISRDFKHRFNYNNYLPKVYLFSFFLEYICPVVEYLKDLTRQENEIYFLGSKHEKEYKILKYLYKKYPQKVLKTNFFFYDWIISSLSNAFLFFKRKKQFNSSKFINSFCSKPVLNQYSETKIIVLSILEERRYSRINLIYSALKSAGYNVVLYSIFPKVETFKGIKQYPNLGDIIINGNALISKQKAKLIIRDTKKRFRKTQKWIIRNETLGSYTYKGVPLIKIFKSDFFDQLLYRSIESELNIACIDEFLRQYNVRGFIGLDNGVATGAWLHECTIRKIPSFFYFYNALQSPVLYQLMYDSHSPTAWLLSGNNQLESFRRICSGKKNNFHLIGDLLTDVQVSENTSSIRERVFSDCHISYDNKVVLLLSSYVVADFTEEKKKTLFQTTFEAVKELQFTLLIKPHPNEDVKQLRDQLSKWNIECALFMSSNIREACIVSDIVCMYFSEAAQQAMLLKVPVISIIPENAMKSFDQHWNYYSTKSVVHVPLGTSPFSVMKRIISDKEFKDNIVERATVYMKNIIGFDDGRNSERFIEKVTGVLNSSIVK